MVASSKHANICALADGSHLARVATRRRFPGPTLSRAVPTPTWLRAALPRSFGPCPVSSLTSLHSPISSPHSPSCLPGAKASEAAAHSLAGHAAAALGIGESADDVLADARASAMEAGECPACRGRRRRIRRHVRRRAWSRSRGPRTDRHYRVPVLVWQFQVMSLHSQHAAVKYPS